MVLLVRGDAVSMRASKIAVAAAIAEAVTDLVPESQVYSVERAVVPVLPCVEVIGVTSERQERGPMLRHELTVEVTVSHVSEDSADTLLNSIVGSVRGRLLASETGEGPHPSAR